MQFINASIASVPQGSGIDGILRQIETAGRVSYKSEDRITEDSYTKFIEMLESRGHLSPMEHGTVYLQIPVAEIDDHCPSVLLSNPFTTYSFDENFYYFTTNYRVIVENGLKDMLKYLCEPTSNHTVRLAFRIVCSRGVSHELVRHRVFSFTQESTRYCNYSKDKYDNCITYIIPSWVTDVNAGDRFTVDDISVDKIVQATLNGKKSPKTMMLISTLVCAESAYMELLKEGCTPQQAREVLPNALKTEVVMTGTLPQWKQFLALRSPAYGAKGMHPDMAVIGDLIYDSLKADGYLNPEQDDKND